MEWHFDKDTVKLLRYIYNHKGITEGKIKDKFKDPSVSLLLINLSTDLYLIAEDENGKSFIYEKDKLPYISVNSTKWYTTPKSNLVVQNDTQVLWKWLVPLIISAISLFLSGINFIFNWLR